MNATWVYRLFHILWRSLIVGAGYILGVILSGVVLGMLGLIQPQAGGGDSSALPWMYLAGVVMGLTLGPVAQGMPAGRWRHLLVWTCVIFFNIASVIAEGVFFAPDLVPVSLPVLVLQQLLAALLVGLLVTVLFSSRPAAPALERAEESRPWYAWLWRFALSASSYLLFYWVFGGINYALVTRPYYETHAGGLAAPPGSVVLLVEMVRAPLIVLSVLPFLLTLRAGRRRTIVLTGLILFLIGGIAPLLFQAVSLPFLLLAASAVEIFFQNFLTGAVAALLLGRPAASAAPALQHVPAG